MLTIGNVQTNNGATNYTVIVTNMTGLSATSSPAALTVYSTPVIIVQPTDQAIAVGSNAVFFVNVIGTVPLHYQWWVNGTNLVKNGGQISGATTNMLSITNAQTANSSNYYTVIITNIAGSVTSAPPALLTVTNIPPNITLQPLSQTNGVGTPLSLAVTATGTAPLRYQWQRFGTNLIKGGSITTVTSNVLTISAVQTNNSGDYTVVVTNFGGAVTSSVATVTVISSPVIFTQPASQTNAVGSNVMFSVFAIGTVPLSYQWQVNGTNLTNGGSISGAKTNVLQINQVQTSNSATNYMVIIKNVAGSATSSVAILLVTNKPPRLRCNQRIRRWW